MHILAFRHVKFEHVGRIAPALARAGLDFTYVDLFERPAIPAGSETASGLIFMGGPMSANDDLPFLRAELDLIQRALELGKPVLGICLGAQLLARALGGRVYPNAGKEIGWAPVYWTEAARHDPLFRGLAGPEMLFHWHGETFDLPAGCEWLAWSDGCRNQAFRHGAAWGLQFHLEVTPEMIAGWCTEDANAGDVRELDRPLDPHAHAVRLAELAELVFGRWAEVVKAPPSPGY